MCFGVLHVVVGAPRTTWISDRSARPITANEVRSFMPFENRLRCRDRNLEMSSQIIYTTAGLEGM